MSDADRPSPAPGVAAIAPVLIVPRVLEPELCRGLIDGYEAKDISAELKGEVVQRLKRNLLPMILRAFQFRANRIERFLVIRDDEGGQVRRIGKATGGGFAVSINLNAEAFEGGDLRFPEFGSRTYRSPTGGALVYCAGLPSEVIPVTRGRRYAFLPFLLDGAVTPTPESTLESAHR